ncbi:uncharacterized protein PAC_00143 [Phialocephala subalpina]|uniref:DUF6604 domain-containing protein n=1 Tax=Phialocephala subalpina TaxID=576137 RepID=A0A1L7WBV8_9HELO|nr:uncharacterized protein PAC_00143 [Phialocephala subalpina]
MLPDNLASSYDRYKKDTNTFVAWLHANALSCGYTAPINIIVEPVYEDDNAQPGPGCLKGKARKEAQVAAMFLLKQPKPEPKIPKEPKHVLPTIQLVKQAKAIAASPKNIKVPIIIQRLLHQAIGARKRCTNWFTNMLAKNEERAEELDKSNHTHENFIKVLEMTYDILEPCFEMPKQQPARAAMVADVDDDGNEVINRFEILEMEDIDEAAYDSLPSVTPQSNPKVGKLELEIDVDADLPFMAFCFYEDLHRMRNFLIGTWFQVREGKLNYMAAALTTNVGMELVRKAEQELVRMFPGLEGGSYRTTTSKIYPVRFFNESPEANVEREESMAKLKEELVNMLEFGGGETQDDGDNGSEGGRQEEEGAEGDESVPFPTEEASTEKTAYREGEATIDDFVFTSVFHSLEKCHTTMKYGKTRLPMVLPITFLYMRELDLLPRSAGSCLTIEDNILSLIMLDVELIRLAKVPGQQAEKARHVGLLEKLSEFHIRAEPVSDEITRALEAAREPPKLDVTQVFMARILLDIMLFVGHGEAQEFHTDLVARGVSVDKRLEITWSTQEKVLKLRNGCEQTLEELREQWGARKEALIAAALLSKRVNVLIKSPHLVGLKHVLLGKELNEDFDHWPEETMNFMRKMDVELKKLVPSPDPLSFYRHQPVYCGLEALRTTSAMHNIGINLANDFYSFLTMAHLSLVSDGEAIQANLSRVFNGSLPSTIDKRISRFFLCIGVPLTYVAQAQRGHSPNFSSIVKKPKDMLEASDVAVHLLRYLEGEDPAEKLLFNMQKGQKQAQAPGRSNSTRLQLLAGLRDSINESISVLDIDMVSLVRNCNALFHQIRDHLPSSKRVPDRKLAETSAEMLQIWNQITTLEILTDLGHSDLDQSDLLSRRTKVQASMESAERTKFSFAAETINGFLRTGNESVKAEPFDVIAAMELPVDGPLSARDNREVKKWRRIMELR